MAYRTRRTTKAAARRSPNGTWHSGLGTGVAGAADANRTLMPPAPPNGTLAFPEWHLGIPRMALWHSPNGTSTYGFGACFTFAKPNARNSITLCEAKLPSFSAYCPLCLDTASSRSGGALAARPSNSTPTASPARSRRRQLRGAVRHFYPIYPKCGRRRCDREASRSRA